MITDLYIIQNTDSKNEGFTGKELVAQEIPVTLASSAAVDVKVKFAPGTKVYVVPTYELEVTEDGDIDVDFSAATNLYTKILVIGKTQNLKSSY